jgi:CheY-like chemotaxis protein
MTTKSIMIIEDDRDIRENLRLVLEGDGFVVLEANNGREGLDLLASKNISRPGLILLDLMMPVMDGKTFLQIISSLPHINEIPIVVLTASSEKFEQKIAGFMRKPLDIDELLAVARKYC